MKTTYIYKAIQIYEDGRKVEYEFSSLRNLNNFLNQFDRDSKKSYTFEIKKEIKHGN